MLRAIFGALTHARLSLVVLALALHVTGLLITGERWRVVIAALGTKLTLWRTTLVNLAGIFVRNATPTTGLGGDASRIALLRAEGMGLAQATASFAYVRLAELPPLVLVVLLSAPAIAAVAERSARALLITCATLAVCGAALWAMRGTLETQFASLWERTAHLRIDRTAAGLAVVYATLAQAETISRQIVVAAAFGVPLTIEQSATVTAMTIVGGFVPTVGSIGAIDGSMVAGLMLFGASAGDAIAITIVGRAISYGVSTAMGAAALLLLGGRGIRRAVSARKTNTAAAG
jgi:glycosyltransferase 2 family protein